jgi:fructoselysine-6-P-deglycase FrlB-like protein
MTAFDTDCRLILDLLPTWPDAGLPLLRRIIDPTRPLLVIGEGSSQLFPGGFLRALARQRGWPTPVEAVGGRHAARLDLTRWNVICASNSGRSREVCDLLPRLAGHPTCAALVGIPGGPLCALPHHVLLPRAEAAVPATSSVLATALALGQALDLACGNPLPAGLATALRSVLDATPDIPDAGTARRLFWVGGSAGVSAELALKTMESTGRIACDLPGSLGLHGIHEVLEPGDLVLGLDIDAIDQAELRRRVETLCGARLLLVQVPDLGAWTPLLHLAAGWRILAAIAAAQGRDPAVPRRAAKVGNPAI